MRVRASADSKKGRGDFEGDNLPVLTLVRQSDGRVRFLVCKDSEDVDEDIAEYGDSSAILCTDGYSIFEDIEEKEGVDGHPSSVKKWNRKPTAIRTYSDEEEME